MIQGARVTLGVGTACIIASALAALGAALHHPLLAWMVHVDVQHLVVNVVTWTVLGALIERLAGWQRMVLWVAAGLGVSLAAHVVAYPEHERLYGMSSIGFFVFAAGVTAYAPDRWWGRLLLAGMGMFLAFECATGETGANALAAYAGGGGTPRLLPATVDTTPVAWVHVACAAAGLMLGGLTWWSVERASKLSRSRASSPLGLSPPLF